MATKPQHSLAYERLRALLRALREEAGLTQRDLGLKVTTSNLCSEIMLHTGPDHHGVDRTAVCCLSSLNVETWEDWWNEKEIAKGMDGVWCAKAQWRP